MKKIFIVALLMLCLWSVVGVMATAQSTDPSTGGLVTCGRGTGTADKPAALDCNFAALMNMINVIIRYMIFISLPLAAIAFAIAGWIYLSAGGDTGKVKKAKQIFISVGTGFALILSAWLIFQYIANTFLSTKPDSSGATYSTYFTK